MTVAVVDQIVVIPYRQIDNFSTAPYVYAGFTTPEQENLNTLSTLFKRKGSGTVEDPYKIEAKYTLYSLFDVSAFGVGAGSGGGGGLMVNILDSWDIYDTSKEMWALSAKLGKSLLDGKKDNFADDYYSKPGHTHSPQDITGLEDLSILLEWFEWDEVNQAIKVKYPLYSIADLSAFGIGSIGGGGGGVSYDMITDWDQYNVDRENNVVSARLIYLDHIELQNKVDINHNHDSKYLQLIGGTVTGDLILKNARINNTLIYSPIASDDILNIRRYEQNHTILNIMAPPQQAWGKAKEATLALVRGDGNEYFLDLYNMDYGNIDAGNNLDYGNPIMGLRMQKRATGVYTPFKFEYGDGTNVLPIMQLLPHTSSGSTNNSFVSITNRLTIGYGNESKTQALAVNGAIDLTGTLTGTNATFSSYVNALGFALGAYAPYGYRFYQNDSSFAFGMYGESGIYKLQAAYQGTNSYTDFTRGFRVFNTTDNYEEFYTGKGRLELTRAMNSSSEFYSFDNGIKLDKAVLSFYQLSSTNGYARVLDIGAFGRTDYGYYGNNAESIIRFLYNTTGAYSGGVEAARFWRGSFQLGFTGDDNLSYKLAVNGNSYISGSTIIGGNFYGYGIGSFSGMVLGTSFKTGNWEIIPISTTQLQLQFNGVMVAKLDSAGNILATGNVTAYAI